MRDLTFVLTVACALGAGLVGGIFFAFSTFVMAALGRLPPAHGIAAMQSINIIVLNRLFLGPFIGTAVLCAVLVVLGVLAGAPGVLALVAGSLLYVVGTFGVTLRCNVPLNEALARVEPTSAEGASVWTRYLADWTFWNHVRTAASLLATVAFMLAL
jgi:uncharacterized membrane protein